MMYDEKTIRWLTTLLKEVSQLPGDRGVSMLEKCGKDCSCAMGTAEKAKEIRGNATDPEDIDSLLELFKKEMFTESPLYREGDDIHLIYTHKECECPLVSKGKISDPFSCNCTRGHTKAIFEALLGGPVEVVLEESILRGHPRCKQTIRLKRDY